MIQQSINQTISLAGFLLTQTPAYQKAGEVRGLNRQLKTSLAAGEEIAQTGNKEDLLRQGEMVGNIREKIFQTKPTAENYEAVMKNKQAQAQLKKEIETEAYEAAYQEAEDISRAESAAAYEEEMRQTADYNLAKKQEAKRETARRKMGYTSPRATFGSEMGRKEKRKITTQIEQQNKEMKKEEQRNG